MTKNLLMVVVIIAAGVPVLRGVNTILYKTIWFRYRRGRPMIRDSYSKAIVQISIGLVLIIVLPVLVLRFVA